MQQQPDEMRMTVVDATKFGAVGDGKTDSTNAINECLAWKWFDIRNTPSLSMSIIKIIFLYNVRVNTPSIDLNF
ncbi:hypothetical protein DT075_34045 [Bacillus licheniformis]|nr:hypothetical protein DT075_34045 [Bacillus licheniformis]